MSSKMHLLQNHLYFLAPMQVYIILTYMQITYEELIYKIEIWTSFDGSCQCHQRNGILIVKGWSKKRRSVAVRIKRARICQRCESSEHSFGWCKRIIKRTLRFGRKIANLHRDGKRRSLQRCRSPCCNVVWAIIYIRDGFPLAAVACFVIKFSGINEY